MSNTKHSTLLVMVATAGMGIWMSCQRATPARKHLSPTKRSYQWRHLRHGTDQQSEVLERREPCTLCLFPFHVPLPLPVGAKEHGSLLAPSIFFRTSLKPLTSLRCNDSPQISSNSLAALLPISSIRFGVGAKRLLPVNRRARRLVASHFGYGSSRYIVRYSAISTEKLLYITG
jgi:hypothetical protein